MTELPPPVPGCASCAARDQVIAELGRAVEELRAEVADLRRRLGRNSRNSSMPPSTDDLPGRVPPRREQRERGTGRKRGKQPGAPGTSMSWTEPDEVVDHRPAGACDGCGAGLSQAARHQALLAHQARDSVLAHPPALVFQVGGDPRRPVLALMQRKQPGDLSSQSLAARRPRR